MMESIEKLREFIDDQFVCSGQAYLQGMAIAGSIEREIAERYMLLPVDADGVPIHPGNRVEMDGKGGEVWLVGTTDVMCSGGMSYRAVAVNHAKPDPLKELLSELANEVWEASCTCQTTWSDSGLDGIEERYAERIRELMEVRDGLSD